MSYSKLSSYVSDSDNSFQLASNLSFRSAVWGADLQLEFNFLPYTHGSKDEYFTPYIFGGFSVVNFNPQAEIDDQWFDLRDFGTEGQFRGEEYYSITGGFDMGFGFKFDLSYEWSINLFIVARHLFTDYLDDVSTEYPDMDDLESLRGERAVRLSDRSGELGTLEVPLGQTNRQRGNSSTNDTYATIGIGLIYYFGDLRCPEYSR